MLTNYNTIYLDFDGTVTKFDTVNTFFRRYASGEWLKIEQDWVDGKITSKDCMHLELDLIKNLTQSEFENFLNSIEIQDGFTEFCNLAESFNKNITILSDGFDLFISKTLEKINLTSVKFYANKLNVYEENGFLKFKLTFPNENKNCAPGLGMCKCNKVQKDEKFIYAGDGLSDRCIARKSNLLFAKNSLRKHCIENNISFIEFENFFQISNHLFFKEGASKCRI